MATVIRTRTIVERVCVEDDGELEFDPRAAAAVARTRADWETVSDTVTFDVHDDNPEGCTVSQLTGRTPR